MIPYASESKVRAMRRAKIGRLTSGLGPFLLVAIPAALVILGLLSFRSGPAPRLTLETKPAALGPKTRVVATAEAGGRGLAGLRLTIAQGTTVRPLAQKAIAPRPAWAFWGPRETRAVLEVELGREALAGLNDGEATLRLSADRATAWLWSPGPVVEEIARPLRLRPPTVESLSTQNAATEGGAGVVVYRVGASAMRDGVAAADWWFPGHPLPGGAERDRFAIFGIPFDLTDKAAVRLVAEDDVGNRSEIAFLDRFTTKPFATDSLTVKDEFLAKVVPEILAHAPEVKAGADPVQSFLAINRDLRRSNAETLKKLALSSAPKFLWSRRFESLPRAKVMSAFADRRSYSYGGQPVDQQTHLGFDLAATRNTPVPAANDGIVVLAQYFGIYGNAVVIDHGFGLMSLYAHLASIDVAKGQSVGRGDILGRTGATGLAGGDHLHFTMLIQGLPVNPTEWWDAHWIRDHLARPLGPVLPFAEADPGPPQKTEHPKPHPKERPKKKH
jgi:murein DD-endopeptidase MepM/ murein hydrolase activator NlpD